MPLDNLSSFASGARTLGATVGGNVGNAIGAVGGIVGGATSLLKSVLPKGGVPGASSGATKSTFSGPTSAKDWRVKLSIPPGSYETSFILEPLKATGGLVFPYTPSVNISHTANYQSLDPVHNNYSFFSYENSKVDRITINGDFYCEDNTEAAYWIAAVHYLRSVTKMYYGENSENAGSPPPVVKLNGYGDFVFANVPVIITNFQVELPKDVDYIPSSFAGGVEIVTEYDRGIQRKEGIGYAPVKSMLSVTCQPIYSRTNVRNFNLSTFINGGYIGTNGGGYI
jgi:hypothetical protein